MSIPLTVIDDSPPPADAIPACALPGSPLEAALPGINACVHCGFCLQACPTYLTLEDENESPRGRIFLMRSLLEGTVTPFDDSVHAHIDRCLGCRACEPACPSGVPYGHLLEATRATLREARRPPFTARLILFVFAHPLLLKLAMLGSRLLAATPIPTVLSRIAGRVGFGMAMLASSGSPLERDPYPAENIGERPATSILLGCVMEGLFAETNRATERVLRRNGYRTVDARGQGCCGALHAHAGDLVSARKLARRNIFAFERSGSELIAVNAAGCGAMMKEYGHLLRDDPEWSDRATAMSEKVRDVSELLAAVGPQPGGHLPLKVTYDAPCHLVHAQRVVNQPLSVLAAIPGLELVPLRDSENCCGSAGIYNLIEPETSDAVLAPKLANIAETGAPLVATGNPGCLMQIGAGLLRSGSKARVIHPVDLLDASYAGAEDLRSRRTFGGPAGQ
ncbi:MAG TPA: heterodisulfide reductase-related iron-sulfur binding cluster [Gemmatimonadaceae bacterium]|nr:heterodisulfide reductase-related iron-sulfur binding cluster [Gemmatimonadaceae bacterium]